MAGVAAARGDRSPGRRASHLAGDRPGRRSAAWSRSGAQGHVFIADGHHRYETACNYRDELTRRNRGLKPTIRPTRADDVHRHERSGPARAAHAPLVPRPAGDRLRSTARAAGDAFTTRVVGEGSDLAPTVWEEIETAGDQGTLGLFTPGRRRWILGHDHRRRPEPAWPRWPPSTVADWQGLGVSILHRLLIDTLLAGQRPAQAAVRPPGGRGRRRARVGRVPAWPPGHAGHGRPHPHDQRARRADAGQEHLLLSQAAQRPGHQSARIVVAVRRRTAWEL